MPYSSSNDDNNKVIPAKCCIVCRKTHYIYNISFDLHISLTR